MRGRIECLRSYAHSIGRTKEFTSIKDAPKRRQLAKDIAKKLKIRLTNFYITSGDCDVLIIMEAPDGDAVA